MTVRNESVRLSLDDAGYSTGMAKAAAATGLLKTALNDLDGTNVRTSRSTDGLGRSIKGAGKSAQDAVRPTHAYQLELAIADERASRLRKSLQQQAKAALDAESGIVSLSGATARYTSATERSGNAIDRTSGRLGLLLRGFAAVGPAALPIGALAVPAVTGLASQLGFAAVGMASLVAASQGVGTALESVNKASLDPTVENLEAAREAMSQLGPHAQAFVARFQELRPVLGDIRDAAAAGWFPGLTEALDSFESVAPKVAQIFQAIGTTGGNLVADAADALAGPEWAEFLDFVAREAPPALDQLGRSVGNVAAGMADLWMAFAPLNSDFSGWMLDASRSFAGWADGLSETEGFQEFIAYVRDNGPKVAEMASSVANALLQIAQAAAPLGGPVLVAISAIADAIAAIADSPLGTPIMAGVAALSALSLASTVATASLARLSAAMVSVRTLSTFANPATALIAALTYEFVALKGAIDTAGDSSASFGDKAQAWLEAAPGGGMFWALDELGLGLGDVSKNADDATNSFTRGAAGLSTYNFALAKTIGTSKAFSMSGLEAKAALAEIRTAAKEAGDSFHNLGDAFESPVQSLAKFIKETEQAARAAANISQNMAKAIAKGADPEKVLDLYDKMGAGAGRIFEQLANGNKGAIRSFNQMTAALERGEQKISALTIQAQKWGQLKPEARLLVNDLASGKIKTVKQLVDNYGLTRAEAKALLDDLASGKLRQVMTLLNGLDGRHTTSSHTTTITTRHVLVGDPHGTSANPTHNADGGTIGAYAPGGTVAGQRYPYGDRVLTYLAPGEEVISNRHGQADRNRSLLKAINANRSERPVRALAAAYAGSVAADPTGELRALRREVAALRGDVRTADVRNVAAAQEQSAEQRRGAARAARNWPRGGGR